MAPIKRLPKLPVLKSEVQAYPKPKDAPKPKLDPHKTHLDGREVCYNTAAGKREYRLRTITMAMAQNWICMAEFCNLPPMTLNNVTFQHGAGRGAGGGHRDDRISAPGNAAWHWICNSKQGSRRTI